MVIHVVQPGDSLYRIAQLHSVPLPFLIQQNELHEPYRLTPGQTIVVPQPEKTYIVRRGDTLGSIAAQNGTTVMQLWQNNPQLGGTDRIQPGQMLVLSYGNKLGRFAVNGYAYPSIDLRVLSRTLPYLTYLSVFSVGFDNTGRILPFSAELLVRMARQYQVKPLLVLTTLGEDGQFSGERAHRLLNTPTARAALIENLGAEYTDRPAHRLPRRTLRRTRTRMPRLSARSASDSRPPDTRSSRHSHLKPPPRSKVFCMKRMTMPRSALRRTVPC